MAGETQTPAPPGQGQSQVQEEWREVREKTSMFFDTFSEVMRTLEDLKKIVNCEDFKEKIDKWVSTLIHAYDLVRFINNASGAFNATIELVDEKLIVVDIYYQDIIVQAKVPIETLSTPVILAKAVEDAFKYFSEMLSDLRNEYELCKEKEEYTTEIEENMELIRRALKNAGVEVDVWEWWWE